MNENQTTMKEVSEQEIQSVLFYLAEPVSFKRLASVFETDIESIKKVVLNLKTNLESTGFSLILQNDEVQLVTHPNSHRIIEKIRKEELTRELTKPALETLSIILYKENVTRSDIDFIRGVNSSFIIRNLLMRGLIIRKQHPTDSRTFIYLGSHELLAYLGISEVKDLPDFERVQKLLQEKVENLLDNEVQQEETPST